MIESNPNPLPSQPNHPADQSSDDFSSVVLNSTPSPDSWVAGKPTRFVREGENIVKRITAQIRDSLDLKTILDSTVREIRSFLNVDRTKIYQFAPDASGEVIAEALQGDSLPSLLGLHFPAGDIPPYARQMFIQTRQRVIVDVNAGHKTCQAINLDSKDGLEWGETSYVPVDPCHQQYLKGMGVVSSMVLPILTREGLWGLFVVHHRESRLYSDRELQIVQLVVDQVSIAIAQSQLLQQAQQQAEHEAALNAVSNILHATPNAFQNPKKILEITVQATGSNGGRLYILSENNQPTQLHHVGIQPHLVMLEETPFWQNILATSTTAPQPPTPGQLWDSALPDLQDSPQLQVHYIENVKTHPPFQNLQPNFREQKICSLLVIPLRYQQRCIGCLTLFRQEIETATLWAGRSSSDHRNYLPRRSFDAWREISRGIPPQWSLEEIKLAQAISLQIYMAVMERHVKAMLHHQAYHDHLTGLPNRMLFNDNLNLALANTRLGRGELMAVLFLDLDGFKTINDTLGHYIGDEILIRVGQRLRTSLPPEAIVARWGGDEFTILLCPLRAPHNANLMAQKILTLLNVPFTCQGKELYVKGSIGIAIAPYHGEDSQTLLKHADAALYEAKQKGRNIFQLYTPELSTQAQQRLVLEHSLYKALERQEFSLHYQPQFCLTSQKIVGMEALIRWHSEEHGWISPAQFIPLAEETGLINGIGDWVLETACQNIKKWQGLNSIIVPIAVNLSARQFQKNDLVKTILNLLNKLSISPRLLELEITESIAMQDVQHTVSVLRNLQKLGIKIAMDDFGTGYSSLAALKYFPLDKLKIDQSFVRDLTVDSQDEAIVKSIIALGHGLNLTVVAEGVETKAQLDWLESMGCDLAQGYFISRPLAESDARAVMG
ncbi:EAL domain-containing protein [Spirulina subsalsa FACHB-351]|uniref:EAL domain-containing protein n=1 Tax=Spirulina subsalsa FACHB-351 TaxID=234711 RepID=A0ABT3L1A8_9CYAN|nr:EAL domain-containing protein [Spirulina subsalsa]MCW6035284.1 EAL domain-containing protein [Spirulina subsalsa FACHB-351]